MSGNVRCSPSGRARARKVIIIWLGTQLLLVGNAALAKQDTSRAKLNTFRHLVEKKHLDWTRSGKQTTFSLLRIYDTSGVASDLLSVSSDGKKAWTLRSQDGGWASLSEAGLANLKKQNLIPTSQHFLFVSSGSAHASIYLILKGVDSGCCVGSLTVLTPDEHGRPRVVFHSSSHLLTAVSASENNDALELIGQPTDSEARALKNAQSYDPYRVYLLDGDQPARYDLALSKAYTLAHYCQWRGPKYNENFVAVGATTGADHCRVMSESDFTSYRQKYLQYFPEP